MYIYIYTHMHIYIYIYIYIYKCNLLINVHTVVKTSEVPFKIILSDGFNAGHCSGTHTGIESLQLPFIQTSLL